RVDEFGCPELLHQPRDDRRGAPVEPRGMGTTDLEVEDPAAHRIEAAFGLQLPVRRQIARFTQCQMDLLTEVFTGLTIAPPYLVGDVFGEELPELIVEILVLGRQFNAGKIHLAHVDHEGPETVESLERMRHAVAGQVDADPGDPELPQLVQAVQVSVGVERVVGGTAALEVGEGDVDRGPIPARRIASAPEVVDALGELLHRVDDGRTGGLRQLGRRGKRAPAVAVLGHPLARRAGVAADPDRWVRAADGTGMRGDTTRAEMLSLKGNVILGPD